MHKREKEENALFQIGWSVVGVLLIIYTLYKIFPFPPLPFTATCAFRKLFGLYCPGCGGTRAVFLLLHGHFWNSFICHPLVPYSAIIGGWFLISQTVERISKGRLKIGMRYRDIYLWIALVIVIANFIVKNALLLIWHMDILAKYSLPL